MSGMPQVRAGYAKLAVHTVKRLPEADRDRAMASLGEPLRAAIRTAGLFEWLPVERFVELLRAVQGALGPEGARTVWRSNLKESLERPLLAPLRIGALSLYGRSPRSLLRMTPQAWGLVTRGCGSPSWVDVAEDAGRLRFVDLPPSLCACPELLELWHGGALACAEYVGFDATVTTDADALARAVGEIDVRWWAR